jgi:hypothetical protein
MHLYCLFPKSNHIFDKENLVRKELQKVDVICNGEVLKNYLFKDSKDDMLIQISDVIAGLWAQMNTYVNKKTDEEIRQDITKLSTVQLENLSLLWGLQLKSSIRNQGFFFSIAPVSDRERIIKMMLQAYQHPHGIKNI